MTAKQKPDDEAPPHVAPDAPQPTQEPAATAAAPDSTAAPLTVDQAITETVRRIGAISKDRAAPADLGGFKFRGIDDVLDALHPIVADIGLLILPRVVARETEKIGSRRLVTLEVCFDFIGPDGTERVVGPFVGEGADGQDKAANKAHSGAYKMMAFEVFSIPIKDASVDSESYNPRDELPPTIEELWQRLDERKQEEATRVQDRLDHLPADWHDRVLDRMRERTNSPTMEKIRDVDPGWVAQLRKILDKADEAMIADETTP